MKQKQAPPKVIDLSLDQYKVDRGGGEPFWGDGIPRFIVFVAVIGLVLCLKSWLEPVVIPGIESIGRAIGLPEPHYPQPIPRT